MFDALLFVLELDNGAWYDFVCGLRRHGRKSILGAAADALAGLKMLEVTGA